jgi:transcriptional regulator with XRE-family HTH domain
MVKRLREARGWTQAELAKKARVTRPYITMLESGVRKTVTPVVLKRLAKALDVSMADLSGGQMVTRLGEDPRAPFGFDKGDMVALKRPDGSPDPRNVGVVVDGICWHTPPAGSYVDLYQIRREDGMFFNARGPELVKMASSKE